MLHCVIGTCAVIHVSLKRSAVSLVGLSIVVVVLCKQKTFTDVSKHAVLIIEYLHYLHGTSMPCTRPCTTL